MTAGSGHRDTYIATYEKMYDYGMYDGKASMWKREKLELFLEKHGDGSWTVGDGQGIITHGKECKKNLILPKFTHDTLRTSLSQHEETGRDGVRKRKGASGVGPTPKKRVMSASPFNTKFFTTNHDTKSDK
jgi:hypothetical protein